MRYLKNSNLKLAVDFNPLMWSFQFMTDVGKPRFSLYLRFLFFVVLLIVDDGIVESLDQAAKD